MVTGVVFVESFVHTQAIVLTFKLEMFVNTGLSKSYNSKF